MGEPDWLDGGAAGGDLQGLLTAGTPGPLESFAGWLYGPAGEEVWAGPEGQAGGPGRCFMCEMAVKEPGNWYLQQLEKIARDGAGLCTVRVVCETMALYYAGSVEHRAGYACPAATFYAHLHRHGPDDAYTTASNLAAVRDMLELYHRLGVTNTNAGPQLPNKDTVDTFIKLVKLEHSLHDRRTKQSSRVRAGAVGAVR